MRSTGVIEMNRIFLTALIAAALMAVPAMASELVAHCSECAAEAAAEGEEAAAEGEEAAAEGEEAAAEGEPTCQCGAVTPDACSCETSEECTCAHDHDVEFHRFALRKRLAHLI